MAVLCPYCKYEMEQGYLQNQRPIVWFPAKREQTPFRLRRKADLRENQHDIGTTDPLLGAKAEAWYCPLCRVVLLQARN